MPASLLTRPVSDLLIGRAKAIWGSSQWKVVDKAFRWLDRHGIGVVVACKQCRQPLERSVDPFTGDLRLRCDHLDRIVRAEMPRYRH